MSEEQRLYALLIDGDNVKASFIPQILDAISKQGDPIIRKVYLNKDSVTQSTWDEVINNCALKPEYVPNNTSGKNAADIALVMDATNLLWEQPEITDFCIVSSDSDFTRLAIHIKAKGKTMWGIGERKTPASFRSACSKFIPIEKLLKLSAPLGTSEKTANQKNEKPGNTNIPPLPKTLFIQAYENTAKDQDGWAPLVTIKDAMIALNPAYEQNTRQLAEEVMALAESYPPRVIEIVEDTDRKPTTHSIRVDCLVFRFVEAYRHIPEKEKGGWVLLSTIGTELKKHPAYANGLSYHGKKQLLKVVEEMANRYPRKIAIKTKTIQGGKSPIHLICIKP
jgi:uncharacterized LabA/DUF88 family protein